MAVFLRATIMLLVLVGLPAAWVYYGPLPPKAQKIVDRVMELGQEFLRNNQTSHDEKVAPRYSVEPQQVNFDPKVLPASFAPTQPAAIEEDSLAEQLEPHLSFLRRLGAEEYTLEKWGDNDQMVRFRCLISFGSHEGCNRQFEAIAENSLSAVRQVVGEVSACQNAHGGATQWR